MIQNRINDNLRFLHHYNFLLKLSDVVHVSLREIIVPVLLPRLLMQLRGHPLQNQTFIVLLFLLLADVERVVDLKVDGMPLGLLDLLALKEPDHSLRVIGL